MKNMLSAVILSTAAVVVPISSTSAVDVSIGVSLPPPMVFSAPPEVIVLPDTNDVYVAPDLDIDLFFWNGWWWRAWNGHWYRSHDYDRGWAYYEGVPRFYYDVEPGWRVCYGDHNWFGHRWYYERISHRRLQQNWRSWHSDRHWDRQRTWGVQDYRPRSPLQRQELRYERREHHEQRPEFQQPQHLRSEGRPGGRESERRM